MPLQNKEKGEGKKRVSRAERSTRTLLHECRFKINFKFRRKRGERKERRDFSEAPLHTVFRRKRGEKGNFRRSSQTASK